MSRNVFMTLLLRQVWDGVNIYSTNQMLLTCNGVTNSGRCHVSICGCYSDNTCTCKDLMSMYQGRNQEKVNYTPNACMNAKGILEREWGKSMRGELPLLSGGWGEGKGLTQENFDIRDACRTISSLLFTV